MLYTVGFTNNYDRYLVEEPTLKKLGKGKDHMGKPYDGGCVFVSKEAAQAYLDREKLTEYSVYGLDTDLSNTHYIEDEPYRRLIKSARIIRL